MPDPVADMTLARIRTIAAERVTRINETTRDAIRGAIVEGVDLGEGAAQLGARISEAASLSPYRGELIARTETMHAWNASALGTYADEGVTLVEAEDGDEDDECRERQARDNGYGPGIYTLEEAMAEEDHPNGTLAWSPVISADEIAQLRQDVIDAGLGEEPSAAEQIRQLAAQRVSPVAPPIPAPVVAPEIQPVSAAFDDVLAKVKQSPLAMRDPAYVKVVNKIESALGTIERTFKDGKLPEMPKVGPLKNAPKGVEGVYKHDSFSNLPQSLEFRPTAHMETVFHEMTHFIDQHGFGASGTFGSNLGFARARGTLGRLTDTVKRRIAQESQLPATPLNRAAIAKMEAQLAEAERVAEMMEPVARAIIDSRGYSNLMEALSTRTFGMPSQVAGTSTATVVTQPLQASTAKWITYATDAKEAFARAMGQYLSRRAGPEAIAEIETRLYATSGKTFLLDAQGNRIFAPLHDQWDWADFQAIDDAITKMLDDAGWLVK